MSRGLTCLPPGQCSRRLLAHEPENVASDVVFAERSLWVRPVMVPRKILIVRLIGLGFFALVAICTVWLGAGLLPVAKAALKAQAAASVLIVDRDFQSGEVLGAGLAPMVQPIEDLRATIDRPQWRFLGLVPGIGKIQTEASIVITELSSGLSFLAPYLRNSTDNETLNLEDIRSSPSEALAASSSFKKAGDSSKSLAARALLRPVAGTLRAFSKEALLLGDELEDIVETE